MTNLSQRAVGGPKAVIPGVPAREEPGSQGFSEFLYWSPVSAVRPRNDALRLITNQLRACGAFGANTR